MIALALPASAGTLVLNNGDVETNPISQPGVNTITVGAGAAATMAGTISGTGSVAKAGMGELWITGDNSYSGGTDLALGAVFVTSDSALGTGTISFNGGALGFLGLGVRLMSNDMVLNTSATMDLRQSAVLSGVLSGSGALIKSGNGELTLSGQNTFSGGLYIQRGAVRVASGQALGSGAITLNGGSLVIQPSMAMTITNDLVINSGNPVLEIMGETAILGAVSGAGSLFKTGSGTLALSGDNTAFSGSLVVQGGIVRAESDHALGSGAVSLGFSSGGALGFSYANGVTIGNSIGTGVDTTLYVLSGTATQAGRLYQASGTILTKVGVGDLLVTGQINAGTTASNSGREFRINEGRLIAGAQDVLGAGGTYRVGAAGALELRADQQVSFISGNGQIDVVSSKLTVGGTDSSMNFDGILLGGTSAELVKAGGSALSLNGSGVDYGGRIWLQDGILAVNGNFAGTPVQVTGGRLQGAGRLGDVVVGGGALAGISGTTLSMHELRLSSNSVVAANLGAASGTPLFNVAGDLLLSGTLNVTDAGGFGAGVYRLFNYGGALTNHGLAIGTTPAGYDAGNLAVQTAIAGQVNLVADIPNLGSLLFWDGDNAANWNNGRIDGGSGQWRTGGNAFTDATGAQNGRMNPHPGFVVFGGAAGHVDVYTGTGQVRSTGMQFATSGYTLSGDMFELVAGDAIIRVGDGTAASANYVATISNAMDGGGRLIKTDLGTLVLDGPNTYWGGTEIRQGTLQIGSGGASGSIVGDVLNNGVLAFSRSDAASFGGAISGSGAVHIIGGDITLTGLNSYQGGTTIDGGSLIAGGAGAFVNNTAYTVNGGRLDLNGFDLTMASLSGTGGVVALGAATLSLNQAADTSFAGALSGSGHFAKSGAGRLTLSGDSRGFAGVTTVENGTLVVNGMLGGTMNVLAGSRLQGGGTVDHTIANGTIAPGNSIGTLNVGNITFGVGSSYEVEVNAAGQGDKIVATGVAAINGGSVKVLAGMGNYAPRTQYTILTAAGGRNGQFAGVTSNLAFLDPSLGYDANNVYLTMTRNNVGFQNAGVTRNQVAVGGGVESLGFGNPVYNAVLSLSAPQARGAFDQLSGEMHASANTAMIEDSRFVRNAVNDRIRAAFEGGGTLGTVTTYVDGKPVVAPSDTDRFAVWGQGFGSWGHTDGNGNAARLNRSTGGFFVGADAAVFDAWRFGAVAGYSSTSFDVTDRRSSGSSDNYHVGLYGGTRWGDLAFRTGAAYTWHDISTSRNASLPGFSDSLKGKYDAGTAQLFGELGYGINASAARFEPFANLAYVSVHTEGFTERGGAAALASQGATTDGTFTTLGLRASTTFVVNGAGLTTRGMLGWRHAFGDVTPLSTMRFAGGGNTLTIAGVPIARDAAVIEAGVNFALTADAVFGLTYGGQFGAGMSDQSVKANLDVRF